MLCLKGVKSRMNNPKYIEQTLGDYLSSVAEKYPNNIAIKYNDRDYCRTWRELDAEVDRVAKGFLALGIGKGDHVAIWATNVPEWYLTLFACSKIGAVLVTVNTNYKTFEAEYLLRQSDTKALVLIEGTKTVNYCDIMEELCPEMKGSSLGKLESRRLPCLRAVIHAGDNAREGMGNWSEVVALADSVSDGQYAKAREGISCHDVTNMQYTSGTTGFPKGVMLTHYNILNNGRNIGDSMKFTPNDRLCVCVPLFHCFGLVLATMASVTHATTMIPVEAYSPSRVLKALSEEKCTAVHGVPTMFIAMLAREDFDTYDLTNMRTGIMAGSPCPIKVMQEVVDRMNMRDIVIVYGQTEASPGCTMTTTEDSIEKRVATVGKAFPYVETKIVDPATGETLGVGKQGEFCARGYNIMKGYYKMEEATRQAIDADGWLHTGDLAEVDADGYYKITGRIKDMIIRGGENIYPKEIEEFLYTKPYVSDVQVIGVPSVAYGEEICACIILKEGESVTEEQVKADVKAGMAKYKVPSYVLFMDDFFMTASGKIQKYKLREYAIDVFNLHEANNIETA